MRPLFFAFVCAALLAGSGCASSPPDDPAGVTAVLEGFYSAMKTGDQAAALGHLAPDAVFVEAGRLETRAEYEKNHLPADTEFERAVNGTRGPVDIKFNGNTAWAIATTEYAGTFKDAPVHFISAQLMVLTRADGPWMIRTVHWSSRKL